MKKLLLITGAFLISASVFSQEILKGPASKNAKLGKSQATNVSLVFDSKPTLVKGPEAKNFKVWNKESSAVLIRTRKEINNPKGLQAKNRKVWEESESVEVDSKASYELPKSMKKRKLWWH